MNGYDPATGVDPSGLEEVQGTAGTNAPAGFFQKLNDVAFKCPSRDNLLVECKRVNPKDLPKPPPGWDIKGVSGGEYFIWNPHDNALVGPRGAGSCSGLILIPPPPKPGEKPSPIYAFHFYCTESPLDTTASLGGNKPGGLKDFKFKGYKAILCGSERQDDQATDEATRRTLSYTLGVLFINGVKDITYVPGPNALVDKEGKIYWDVPPGLNLSGYK